MQQIMTLKYVPHFIIAVLLGFVVHELAHFGMGRALGYDMFISINKAGPSSSVTYTSEVHAQLVAAVPIPALSLIHHWCKFRSRPPLPGAENQFLKQEG